MNNKKTMSIILGLILVIGLGVAVFVINENGKTKPNNDYVTVKYTKASVGSILVAELSDAGKEKYPKAYKYSIYNEDGAKELSVLPEKLGEEVTAYPKVLPGENIQVFIYDEVDNLMVKLDTKVIK